MFYKKSHQDLFSLTCLDGDSVLRSIKGKRFIVINAEKMVDIDSISMPHSLSINSCDGAYILIFQGLNKLKN